MTSRNIKEKRVWTHLNMLVTLHNFIRMCELVRLKNQWIILTYPKKMRLIKTQNLVLAPFVQTILKKFQKLKLIHIVLQFNKF
jgi:hypothetical protein